MALSPSDRGTLRSLASRLAQIAASDEQQQLAEQWRDLNGLRPTRPLVRIFQIPWNEFAQEDKLQLTCEDPWAREVENGLRMALYQHDHMRDDFVFDPVMSCALAVSDSGFGVGGVFDRPEGEGSVRFHGQIKDLDDVQRIQFPTISHDKHATEQRFQQLSELFEGIMPVKMRGISHYWFAPWDVLIQWYGIETAMLDMVLRPDLVNAAMSRLVDAYLHRLDQWEQLNLLALPDMGTGVGSGGLGLTDELPQSDCDPAHVRPTDLWGCATPQIFSEVSPAMHEEFALQHELRWLERWGLNYYGCCEPLHTKIGILKQVPRLRKISCSPKADKVSMAEQCGTDYVISLKPNPAIFAGSYWDPEVARRELREDLEKLRGCIVEIVLKDISTVSFQPQRLHLWAQIAREEAERFVS